MYRRRSLFGPIILVLFGTMFLVRNFRPDIPVWSLFGQYWPVLLIVLGVLKLIQVMMPEDPNSPPRPVMAGGEVFMILLLCLLGLAIFKGRTFNVDFPDVGTIWGSEYNFNQEVRQTVSEAQPNILVTNPSGNVSVEGADIKEIEVKADKRVRALEESEANRIGNQARIAISRDGAQYVVRVDNPSAGRRVSYTANLEIRVPFGATVKVEEKHGDVTVREVTGAVTINSDRGDVHLENIGGKVHLDLRRGSLSAQRLKGNLEMDGRGSDIEVTDVEGDVSVHGEYTGSIAIANVKKALRFTTNRTDIEIQRLPGKMDMSIGSLAITEPSGTVTVRTSSKDIRIDDFDGAISVTDRDAGVELSTKKTPLANIDVENKSGRVEVTLPASGHFQVDASARHGEVNSEFSDLSTKHENDNGTMTGTVGKSGSTIKLNTSYGNINLHKQN